MADSTPKKQRQSTLDRFASPSKTRPNRSAADEDSSSSPFKRAIVPFSDELLERSVGSHKKLRSSPQYTSEAQIRDFYQKLQDERLLQIQRKQDLGEDRSRKATVLFVIPLPNESIFNQS